MPQCGSRGAPDYGGEGQSSENVLLHGTKPNTTSWLISSIVRSCGDCGAVMAQITAVTVRTAKTNIVMRFSSASSLPCFADRRRLQRTEARRCEALRTTRQYLSPAGAGDGATRPVDRLLSPRASAGAGTDPPIAKGGSRFAGARSAAYAGSEPDSRSRFVMPNWYPRGSLETSLGSRGPWPATLLAHTMPSRWWQ